MDAAGITAAYRRALGEFEPIALRRYDGAGSNRPFFDYPCQARVTDFQPEELVGDVRQGDRKLIILAEDLVAVQFPGPVRRGDAVMVRGKELRVEHADDSSRRVGTVLMAYEVRARGL